MRVVVAGASGVIGRRIVPQLIAANHTVVGVTRRPGSLRATGAEEVVADVSNRAHFLDRVADIRADAVVHQLTALHRPPLTYRDMRLTNRLRQEGTSTLIAAARAMGASRFVAASVFYGYGLRDHGRTPVDESAPFGESQRENDHVQLALQSLEQQMRAFGGVTLRYGLIYDPDLPSASAVPARWRGLLPMLHVEDAAGAVVAALASDARGAFNIADEHPVTFSAREQILAAARGTRAPLSVPDAILRAAAPFGSQLLTRTSIRLSTARAREQLGWAPAYPSLEVALDRVSARSARVAEAQ